MFRVATAVSTPKSSGTACNCQLDLVKVFDAVSSCFACLESSLDTSHISHHLVEFCIPTRSILQRQATSSTGTGVVSRR